MYKKEEIEDSLEFCKQIQIYYEAGKKDTVQANNEISSENVLEDETAFPPIKHTLEELSNEPLPAEKNWTANFCVRFAGNVVMLGLCVLIAYFLAFVVTNYVAHETTVEGESMEPSLSDGDSIIVQKVSYYLKEPARFDVIVFPVQDTALNAADADKKTYYVKRIIGLPGETVLIQNGMVYINGEELKGDKYCLSEILNPGNAEEPVVLGEDEYFVLGDNRNRSTDSRSDYVGMVQREDIVGKVFLCIWPWKHIDIIS